MTDRRRQPSRRVTGDRKSDAALRLLIYIIVIIIFVTMLIMRYGG